jgi:hypothetical protein
MRFRIRMILNFLDEAKICLKNTLIPAFSEFFIFFLCKVICKTNLKSKINFLD